jgi:hypothetical protein
MPGIVMVLIGFVAGILAMTVLSLYKWFFNIWNGGIN